MMVRSTGTGEGAPACRCRGRSGYWLLGVMLLAHTVAAQVPVRAEARRGADSAARVRQSLKLLLHASPQDEHVFLTWNEQPGASYRVRWRADDESAWHRERFAALNYTIVDSLVNGKRYQFQVRTAGGAAERSSDIVSEVPRVRDDCSNGRTAFCSVPDLLEYARKWNLDVSLIRCWRYYLPVFDIDSPNCRYTISGHALTLNRSLGGSFQPLERMPDAASVRGALRWLVFGADDPLLTPGSLTSVWQNVFPPTGGNVDISDTLTNKLAAMAAGEDAHPVPILRSMVMPLYATMMSRLTWFSLPDHLPRRYAIYNEGHGEAGIGSAAPVINWLLRSGWQVLVLDMPLEGLNAVDVRYPLFDHDDVAFAARDEGINALRWFLLPVAGAVDLVYDDAKERGTGVDLLMLGRSGGGFTTMLYSAMDPRVTVAANISGGAPHSVFLDPTVFKPLGAHYENDTSTLYDQVSMTDFLLTAGTKGNFHFFSTHDPCCYTFSPKHPWIQFLNSLQSQGDKKYRVFVDERSTIHGLGTSGLAALGRFLQDVGLPSREGALTPAQIAKQTADSAAGKARTPAAKVAGDSTRAERDSARARVRVP